jgi:hypothetical protein
MDVAHILSVNDRRMFCVFVRMSNFFPIIASLFFAMGMPMALAEEMGASSVREMSADANVQEQFFAKYPDLAEERDVVSAAARQLAGLGNPPGGADAAAEELATRARAILARRTPQEWQRKAVSLFPELGVAGSEFNRLFLDRYRELERTSPQFQQEPSWPVLLAKRCADELQARSLPQNSTGAVTAVPLPPKTAENAAPLPARAQQSSGWLLTLSVVLLGALLWLPAWRMFRVVNASGQHKASVPIWQRALRVATWTYLAVAFLGLFRTFRANADLGLIDRFGITLLVSLLAGVVAMLPAFLIAWGVAWWNQRAVARAKWLGSEAASVGRGEPLAK